MKILGLILLCASLTQAGAAPENRHKQSKQDLIILTNGFWFFKKHAPNRELPDYWSDSLQMKAAHYLDDYNGIYFNATASVVGGSLTLLVKKCSLGIINLFSTARCRFCQGYSNGKRFADTIRTLLNNDPNGKLNFISHSMGGAYMMGVVEALKGAKDANGNALFRDEEFGELMFLAPFQSNRIRLTHPELEKKHYAHNNDFIAGSKGMKLRSDLYNNTWYGKWYTNIMAHPNATFTNEVFPGQMAGRKIVQIVLP